MENEPTTQTPTTEAAPGNDPAASPSAENSVEQMLRTRFEQQQPAAEPEPTKEGATAEGEQPPAEPTEPTTPEPTENEDAIKADEIKGITPEVQEAVNRRIDKITAKRKAAEERATAAETEREELRAKLTELEQKASQQDGAEAAKIGLPPEYVSKDEATLIAKAQFLKTEKDWAFEHLDGFDGDGTEANPRRTAQEMRKYYTKVTNDLEELGPKANALLAERRKQFLEDLRAGRELRLKKTAAPAPAQPATPPAVPAAPKTPVVPPSTIRRPPVSVQRTQRQTFDPVQKAREGVDAKGLQELMEGSFTR